GCALKPEPTATEQAATTLPNVRVPETWKAFATDTDAVQNGWLHTFGDPALEALVTEALAYNSDLGVAAARVDQAAASVKVAGGALYPAASILGRTGIEDS